MTDRMNTIEIEDVLSSIRRLVSDDLRPGAVPAVPEAAAPKPPTVPRLVLTEALRVWPDKPKAAPQPEPEAGAEPGPGPDEGLAGRLAELEALMAVQDHEFEEDAVNVTFAPTLPPAREAAMPVPEAPFLSDDDADTGAELEWTEAAAQPAPQSAHDIGDVAMLDDALLRALIRDVLREELQGVMGERVTRNLRKLVRAEIARALTTHGIT